MNAARLGRHGGKIAFFWPHVSSGAGVTSPTDVSIVFFDEENNTVAHNMELEEVSDGLFYLVVPPADTSYRQLVGRITSTKGGSTTVPFFISFEE